MQRIVQTVVVFLIAVTILGYEGSKVFDRRSWLAGPLTSSAVYESLPPANLPEAYASHAGTNGRHNIGHASATRIEPEPRLELAFFQDRAPYAYYWFATTCGSRNKQDTRTFQFYVVSPVFAVRPNDYDGNIEGRAQEAYYKMMGSSGFNCGLSPSGPGHLHRGADTVTMQQAEEARKSLIDDGVGRGVGIFEYTYSDGMKSGIYLNATHNPRGL